MIPGFVIAGTHSGVGKTTIATALMAAFTRRGLVVQPFKVGPDFIDPGFHQAASHRISRNLDGWMLTREANLETFARAAAGADIAVIEGVMGLFDGRTASLEEGSTAEMAKWLGAPVVLVADASAMARSVAALVRGFECFDPHLNFAGVLFNRVGGMKHATMLREAVETYCRSAPLGALPRNEKIALPSRHLGLTMAAESLTPQCLDEMVTWVEANANIDHLLEIARNGSAPLEAPPANRPQRAVCNVRIAVARDAAFCFYYEDNLDLLRQYGAELIEFSPIADDELPPGIGGIYLGGGYPELHAAALSANHAMREAIHKFAAEREAPVYAECGGFMYLTEAIVDTGGHEHPMVGLFPTRARMQSRLAALGYRQPELENTLWLDPNQTPRGHEFRYSTIDTMPPHIARAYHGPVEGYRIHSVLASYIHLHFLSSPIFAERFVHQCASSCS